MPELENAKGNRWLTTLVFHKKDPISVIEKLRKFNIESRPLWKPMHLQPVFKDYIVFSNGVSEDLFNRGICLPSGTELSDEDIEKICNIIKY